MKRSVVPIFHVSSLGTLTAVKGTAVESVSAALTQSSPESCETRPARDKVTALVSGSS